MPCTKGECFLPVDRVTTGRSRPGKVSYALACFIFRFLRCPQQSLVKQVNLAYSRDIASEYAPEDVHYISQSFDLDKLMRCGVYLQGHCYSAHDFVINNHNLFEKDSLIVPVFNIHSTQKELQQFLVFDLQGKFLDCVVGTEVLY
nr:hypothetical protein [Pseudomonas aeruginosa]